MGRSLVRLVNGSEQICCYPNIQISGMNDTNSVMFRHPDGAPYLDSIPTNDFLCAKSNREFSSHVPWSEFRNAWELWSQTIEPQDTIYPSALPLPGNVHPDSVNITRALDEALSELRSLKIKYMLQQHPSNIAGAAFIIPFRLRLKFRIKGKRDLNAILVELEKRNEDMKAMTKELRKIARWNLKTSAPQMSNVEPSPTSGHITPPEVEPNFSIPCIENPNLDAPLWV